MKKSSKISEKDKKLFRDTIGDIERIKDNDIIIDKPKPSPHPKRNKENELDFSYRINEGELHEDLVLFIEAIATPALSIILFITISIEALFNFALSFAISAIFQASCFFFGNFFLDG